MVYYAVTTGTTVVTDMEGAEARAWYPLFSVAVPSALCPDLLRFEQIGEADGWRGRVIRGVFFVLRLWPPTEKLPLLFLGTMASKRCSRLVCMLYRRWRKRGAACCDVDRDI